MNLVQFEVAGPYVGIVAAHMDFLGEQRLGAGLLHVFGQVNEHRAGPAGLGDVKGLFDDAGNVVDFGDQVAVLYHRQGHAVDVGLLKRPFADHRLGDLAGNGDQRHGIHVGIGNAGDQVGGAGTAGGHADACAAGRPRIPFSGKRPALLVARQHGADFRASQRLVDFHAGPAGVGEDGIHTLAFEASDQDFAAGHRWSEFCVLAGPGGFRGFSCLCIAHVVVAVVTDPPQGKKTHDRRPAVGFLSKLKSPSTSTDGAAAYDDDNQPQDLSNH